MAAAPDPEAEARRIKAGILEMVCERWLDGGVVGSPELVVVA